MMLGSVHAELVPLFRSYVGTIVALHWDYILFKAAASEQARGKTRSTAFLRQPFCDRSVEPPAVSLRARRGAVTAMLVDGEAE